MNKNAVLLAFGFVAVVFGYKYVEAYNIAKNLEYEYVAFSYDKQNSNSLTISFYIDVKNDNDKDVVIKNSNLNCFLNSVYAGRAYLPYQQVLRANRVTRIIIAVNIQYKQAFEEFWQLFIMASTSVHLTVSGSIRFNGVLVPIPALTVAEFTLKDAITNIANN